MMLGGGEVGEDSVRSTIKRKPWSASHVSTTWSNPIGKVPSFDHGRDEARQGRNPERVTIRTWRGLNFGYVAQLFFLGLTGIQNAL